MAGIYCVEEELRIDDDMIYWSVVSDMRDMNLKIIITCHIDMHFFGEIIVIIENKKGSDGCKIRQSSIFTTTFFTYCS